MSIATRTGDDGSTGLMYNRRVAKSHPRVEAYGSVDELNAALGLARAHSREAGLDFVVDPLFAIQKDLVVLMGELATARDDLSRYQQGGHTLVVPEMTATLDQLVAAIEARKISYDGWATPGANLSSAALDVARTTCRRAERRVNTLRETGETENGEILKYLNRLSDLLWLMARWTETPPTSASEV